MLKRNSINVQSLKQRQLARTANSIWRFVWPPF